MLPFYAIRALFYWVSPLGYIFDGGFAIFQKFFQFLQKTPETSVKYVTRHFYPTTSNTYATFTVTFFIYKYVTV